MGPIAMVASGPSGVTSRYIIIQGSAFLVDKMPKPLDRSSSDWLLATALAVVVFQARETRPIMCVELESGSAVQKPWQDNPAKGAKMQRHEASKDSVLCYALLRLGVQPHSPSLRDVPGAGA